LTVAIYPGSFDPITNGHLEIVHRTVKLFDKVIIGVYDTPDKQLLFSTEERVDLVRKEDTKASHHLRRAAVAVVQSSQNLVNLGKRGLQSDAKAGMKSLCLYQEGNV